MACSLPSSKNIKLLEGLSLAKTTSRFEKACVLEWVARLANASVENRRIKLNCCKSDG